ncbi:hypothetical protein BASA81_007753 [Batrachochytrium salamandrivorans]|nr:hypothetical protein BASA81_007753 [Batrachochytrium salamandrivorans]
MLVALLLGLALMGVGAVDPNQALLVNYRSNEMHVPQDSLAHSLFSKMQHMLHPMLQQLYVQAKPRKLSVRHIMLPMRDGVRLSTYVISKKNSTGKRAAMVSRSPYGPTSDQMANLFLSTNDFVAIVQDQRGTFASEGKYSLWHQDGEDGYDTLEWIASQEWSNGRVYSCGVSADGIGTAAMILTQPKPLQGQVLMWATMEGHATVYPGGVFRQGLITGWMTLMAPLTRGVSLASVLPNILSHSTMGEWWDPIQGPGHYHQVNWPTIHISGWWDIFQGHQVNMFNEITKQSPLQDHYLVMGPLGHCVLDAAGTLHNVQHEAKAIQNGLGLATEVFAKREQTTPPITTKFLTKMKKINVYVQRGGGKQELSKTFWSSFDAWPETMPQYLVLGANKRATLAQSLLQEDSDEDEGGYLRKTKFGSFPFDPFVPTMTLGGNNLVLMLLGRGCGSMDQALNLENRRDALVFTSTGLGQDLILTGKVQSVVYLSTSGKDADVYVSLNDVYYDPELKREVSMQIRYGMQRLGAMLGKGKVVNKDQVYKVDVDMWFTSYVVPAGHKLRVVIASSSSPYYAVNLDGGKVVQRNTIHWSKEHPSHVQLPAVSSLPINADF